MPGRLIRRLLQSGNFQLQGEVVNCSNLQGAVVANTEIQQAHLCAAEQADSRVAVWNCRSWVAEAQIIAIHTLRLALLAWSLHSSLHKGA